MDTLSIIIPVYNERSTLPVLLQKVVDAPLFGWNKQIIVVDDYSTDGTRDLLVSLAEKFDIEVVLHTHNQGKGMAIRSAIPVATGKYTIIQDADLEYNPRDFAVLLAKAEADQVPVVFGSRRLNKTNKQYAGLSFFLGGVLVTWIANRLFGQALTDEPTCYKLFKTEFLRSLPLKCERFEFCPEVTALTALQNIQIPEVPISIYPRNQQEGKKIRWQDGWQAITTLFSYRFPHPLMSLVNWFKSLNTKHLRWLMLAATVQLLVFWVLFGFHPNNDTESFVWTIERFRGLDSPFHPNRYLNPFYPILGATLLRWLPPAMVLVVSNILFYYGLVLATFGLLRRVWKSNFIGITSAMVVATAYPMVRYGLTQVQDIGGWFWFVFILYLAWRWREEKKDIWLWGIGLAVSMGMLTKESGAMGALFTAGVVLTAGISWKDRIIAGFKSGSIPLVTLLVNQWYGATVVGYTSREWFIFNWNTFYERDYTLLKWFGVNATAFNVIWPLFLLGLWYLWRQRATLSIEIKQYLLFVLPGSLSYFAWPLFVGRTVFISAWLIIPIAMFAVEKMHHWRKWLGISVLAVCLVLPSILQYVIQYAPLFVIMDQCQNNVWCAWKFFWANWANFSRSGVGRENLLW